MVVAFKFNYVGFLCYFFVCICWVNEEKRRNVDLSGINVIEMLVRPTLGIMSTGHNINGAGLLILLRVDTIVTRIFKVTMGTE